MRAGMKADMARDLSPALCLDYLRKARGVGHAVR